MGGVTQITAGGVSVSMIDDDRICTKHNPAKWEARSRELWAEIVRPGEQAIDVGAYSGFYAIAAAKLGARAVAMEPVPLMAKRIKENAQLNGVTVDIIEAAASNKNGPAPFYLNQKTYMTAGGCLLHGRFHNAEIKVNRVRLDALHTHRVSAIKIDVEGSERDVLDGARKLLRRDRPQIIMEALNIEALDAIMQLLAGDYVLEKSLDIRNYHLAPL